MGATSPYGSEILTAKHSKLGGLGQDGVKRFVFDHTKQIGARTIRAVRKRGIRWLRSASARPRTGIVPHCGECEKRPG